VVTIEEALSVLLGPERSGDLEDDDLFDAARKSQYHREVNSNAGGVVLTELRRRGFSIRKIAKKTGIARENIRRWGDAPKRHRK
jgi:hypothetical protein